MIGNFKCSLDDKGRIMIPTKLRFHFTNVVYLSLGFEKTLEVRTKKQFEQWEKMLLEGSILNKEHRNLQRAILGNTYELCLDGKGRLQLPIHILNDSTIKKDVVVVGLSNRVEIWDQTQWDNFMKNVGQGLIEGSAEKINKEKHD